MAKMVNAVPLPAIWRIAGLSWASATATRDGWGSVTAAGIVHKVGTHAIEFFRRERTNSLTRGGGSAGSAARAIRRVATGSRAGSSRGGATRRAAGAIRRVATGSRAGSSRGGATRRAAGAIRRIATGSRAGSSSRPRSGAAGSPCGSSSGANRIRTRRACWRAVVLHQPAVSVGVHILSTDAFHIRRICTARSGIGGLSECPIANQQAAANSTHNP